MEVEGLSHTLQQTLHNVFEILGINTSRLLPYLPIAFTIKKKIQNYQPC